MSKISSCQSELLDTKWSTKTKVDKWFGNFVLRTLLLGALKQCTFYRTHSFSSFMERDQILHFNGQQQRKAEWDLLQELVRGKLHRNNWNVSTGTIKTVTELSKLLCLNFKLCYKNSHWIDCDCIVQNKNMGFFCIWQVGWQRVVGVLQVHVYRLIPEQAWHK